MALTFAPLAILPNLCTNAYPTFKPSSPPPAYQCILINVTYHLPSLTPIHQILEEICHKKGWGQMLYTHSDQEGHSVPLHGRTLSLSFSPPLTIPPSIEFTGILVVGLG